MNTKKILFSGALAISLISSPLSVFADEGSSSDDAQEVEEVMEGGGLPGPSKKESERREKMEEERREHASSTEERRKEIEEKKLEHASTTQLKREQKTEDRLESGKERGDNGIERRLKSLDELSKRISEMKYLSADQKADILAAITAQRNELTTLQVKIASDTSTTTLKADLESVSKAHRTYRLVIPTTAITAAAGRVTTIVTQMEVFGTKIEARIAAIKADGQDASKAEAAYADFKAKIADAKAQADAAASLVANLTPDNGDETVAATNNTALKSAKAKIETAQADLKAARKDIGVILQGVKGLGIRKEGEATTTPAQ